MQESLKMRWTSWMFRGDKRESFVMHFSERLTLRHGAFWVTGTENPLDLESEQKFSHNDELLVFCLFVRGKAQARAEEGQSRIIIIIILRICAIKTC